ncbi:MAG TPA: sugar phosphate isomerase/epimerase [Verrucomicrobiae bacterium]|nr:sugar phosphate isomerase/epimerase [Verrucomicrobiae bacterium]
MYSFSTCWNSHRHTDGRAMLREIRDLGFEYAELSHGTRVGLVPGIIEAVEAGEMKISSLHNFCPLPMGVTRAAPNLYQFSDERPRERELAERYTLKTFEFASRVSARMVVTHSGSIEMKDYTSRLLDLAGRGERNTPAYEKVRGEFLEKLPKRKRAYCERMRECLGKILPRAESRGIRLGIENRQALEELPIESDYPELFQQLSSPALAYWHDIGHAQIKENLGFLDHARHLASLEGKLAGFHIHDVQFPGKDHCEPGAGQVDFTTLKRFVRAEHIKVFEFSPSLTAEQARRGTQYVRKLWGME